MAKVLQKPTVSVEAVMVFQESELRALDALVGYGCDTFLTVFYKEMGEAYLRPHEAGLRLLFKSVRQHVPPILSRANDAREAFAGEKIARAIIAADRGQA